ncbi:MAG TPA: hypothetical protein PKA58_26620 [Polyangium sp.]|nr:hypothetical protein [Polyangium sp.]
MWRQFLGLALVVGGAWSCTAETNGTSTSSASSTGSSGMTGGAGGAGSSSSGMGGDGGLIFMPDGGGGACTPVSVSETMCDGKDDDCNGRVDDVDVGKDGICDCLRIGIVGVPGSNPSADFQSWLQARGTTVERTHTTPGEAFDAALPGATIVERKITQRLHGTKAATTEKEPNK